MTSVHAPCIACGGSGGRYSPNVWDRCGSCDGIGRSWAPGAPRYGCSILLSDRDPGEIVTLGNGDRGKILWHMPRRKKKVIPQTTFLSLFDEFTERENHQPIAFPSCVGVASVDVARTIVDRDIHDEKSLDYNDPVHRQMAGRLM